MSSEQACRAGARSTRRDCILSVTLDEHDRAHTASHHRPAEQRKNHEQQHKDRRRRKHQRHHRAQRKRDVDRREHDDELGYS
jgi:hypothetical protein